jgi:CspA family cold shock protein
MTGIVKAFDNKTGKGLIIPSDGRKDVQVHISALSPGEPTTISPESALNFVALTDCEARRQCLSFITPAQGAERIKTWPENASPCASARSAARR